MEYIDKDNNNEKGISALGLDKDLFCEYIKDNNIKMITMRRMTMRWRTLTRTKTTTRIITITMIRVSQLWD